MTTTTKQIQPDFDRIKFLSQQPSKSAAIRRLNEQGYSRGQIAKMLDIKYQHVRNVLITPIKKEKQ